MRNRWNNISNRQSMSDRNISPNGPLRNIEPLTTTAVREGVLRASIGAFDLDNPLSLEQCHRLKEGCHHVVWRVGAHILHALPALAKNKKSLERDKAATTLIKMLSAAPDTLSVPSDPFEIGDWICTLQKRLPGTSLQTARATEKTIEGVTQLLKTLRSISLDQAMKAVYYEHERPNLQKRVAKALRHWQKLKDVGYIQQHLDVREALSSAALQNLSTTEYRSVLLHGDLSMQHILVDESDGTITGVIDWSDAILGDPCEDIAGVALTLGAITAGQVAAKAGYDELIVARGLLLGKCLAIEDLRELRCGDDEQPPEELLRAQFRLAFEGTALGSDWIFQ